MLFLCRWECVRMKRKAFLLFWKDLFLDPINRTPLMRTLSVEIVLCSTYRHWVMIRDQVTGSVTKRHREPFGEKHTDHFDISKRSSVLTSNPFPFVDTTSCSVHEKVRSFLTSAGTCVLGMKNECKWSFQLQNETMRMCKDLFQVCNDT